MPHCSDSASFWQLLEDDMRETEDFQVARLKRVLLRQTWYAGRAVVRPAIPSRVPRERIWGYASRLKTKVPGWEELALFYVRKDMQGNGHLRAMVDELTTNAPDTVRFWGITKKPHVGRVFERHGLVPITKATMPDIEKWASDIGIFKNEDQKRDRLPDTTLRDDVPHPREGERWLYVQLSGS